MSEVNGEQREPHLWRYVLKVASAAGLTAILCCVAPAVLFLVGAIGAATAISFADFFYQADGSLGVGAWVLRGAAAAMSVAALAIFWRKERRCAIDPRRKKKNLVLAAIAIPLLAIAIFLALDRASAWYFDRYIVPAQRHELGVETNSRGDL